MTISLVGFVAVGCTDVIDRVAADTAASVTERSKGAMLQESDIDLARAATPSGLKTLEGMLVAYPGHRGLLELVAETVCQYGAGFLQDDWEAARLRGDRQEAGQHRASARRILARCINYGLMLLGQDWADALWRDPDALPALLAAAGPDQVSGVLWVAVGLAVIIGMHPDDLALAGRIGQVRAMLERVVAVDERIADGLPHMTLGILYSAQSAAVGGNPERGRRHLERARAITGDKSLMIDVMIARYYAVITRDRALFRRLLVDVLRTAPSIWPENRLSNEFAHRKARRYLRHERRWFAR
ncbi:MAG: TRAP transporter TatT component family protein [Myxococcota bacterium]